MKYSIKLNKFKHLIDKNGFSKICIFSTQILRLCGLTTPSRSEEGSLITFDQTPVFQTEASRSFQTSDICTSGQLIQVIRPALHHRLALLQISGAVVGSTIGITHGMSQLRLNHQRVALQLLGKHGARRSPESMPGLNVWRVAHGYQGRAN